MVVNAATNKITYAGDGSATAFSTSFAFDENAEITVTVVTNATDAQSVKTLDSHYTLVGAGTGSAGTVTMSTPPASGETLVIELDPDFTQVTALPRGGTVSPKDTLEPMHDKRVRQILKLKNDVDRAIKVPLAEASAATLPGASSRANKYIGFDANGDVVLDTTIGNWRGAWQTSYAYVNNDVVSQSGNSYICVTAHTSGTFSTDLAASKWNLVAQKGDTGNTGSTGSTGAAATIAVGSVTTGSAGSSATVTNAGSTSAATFNFTIPRGDTGATGSTGSTGSTGAAATIAVGSTTTGNAGTSASVTNAGSSSAATLNFTIPRGDTGATGSTGATGPQGPAGEVSGTPSTSVDNSIARWDGTGGNAIDDTTAWTINDSDLATAGGELNMADNNLRRANLIDYGEVTNALGSVSGSTAIDLTAGNSVTATIGGTTSFSISNSTSADEQSGFVLYLTNAGSATVNWPGSVDWAGGTAPSSLTTSGKDILCFTTIDGGTTWYGFTAGLDLK